MKATTTDRRASRTYFGAAWVAVCLAGWLVPTGGACGEEVARFYLREYRVAGSTKLDAREIEAAVYPFLGPGRTADDVEQARGALEKVFHDKGFQTVTVTIPEQDPRPGIIRFRVVEGKVARLRVTGSKWWQPSRIRERAPSVAEGEVPDFNRVRADLVALNRGRDLRVTPEVRPGAEQGSVEVDLAVEDKLPLHGSLELNNRYSPDTSELRLSGGLNYGNLFQRGHTLGMGFQVAPENRDDSSVLSGYYLARVGDAGNLMFTATKQSSDISTLGGTSVGSPGEVYGLRWLFDPVSREGFRQSVSVGIDYKNLEEDIKVGGATLSSPVEYFPLGVSYLASWLRPGHFTEFNASVACNLRGLGSDMIDYANKRYHATGSFLILRADVAHTGDLPHGMQWLGKIQGQLASQPLINSEQFSGGGLGTARGYLEATQLGDNALFGTLELRSPSLIGDGKPGGDEWRFHLFGDAGVVGLMEALPGQDHRSGFASVGLGTRFRFRDHFNGSLDAAVPLVEQPQAEDNHPRITFRSWLDF